MPRLAIGARIFGHDTAARVGKPIEVYHDPNLMLGRDRICGLCVLASGIAPAKRNPTERPT